MQYLGRVETASSQPGDVVATTPSEFAPGLLEELWRTAKAETVGLTGDELGSALHTVGSRHNYGMPGDKQPDAEHKASWLRSLHLEELALTTACALGRELAWQRFLDLYRAPLTQAAVAITGSTTVGHDLADSLYSELYGLREVDGARRSPLASYSGRGSLLGWLRTTLAQRFVDHHRRTHRETALDTLDAPAPPRDQAPAAAELATLQHAVVAVLQQIAADDRFLLRSYFLDRQPLAQIARLLRVHEATISRRLKRLLSDLRKRLLQQLQAGGMSKRAAEEALGSDPRDLEINLRTLLQSSTSNSFSEKTSQG